MAPSPPQAQLVIKNLSAGYGKSLVLNNVSITVASGESVALIGPNGAGKSTILRSIFALTTLKKGTMHFAGQDLTQYTAHQLVKQHIIYVNQRGIVFPNLTVHENLAMPGLLLYKKAKLNERIAYALELFPALKEKLNVRAHTLSGGQRQQLALGRAWVQNAKLLLLDEPTLGLSPALQEEVFTKLAFLNKENVAILLVEQNARMAIANAQRTYLLENGEIALQGGAEIIHNPMIKKIYLGG